MIHKIPLSSINLHPILVVEKKTSDLPIRVPLPVLPVQVILRAIVFVLVVDAQQQLLCTPGRAKPAIHGINWVFPGMGIPP